MLESSVKQEVAMLMRVSAVLSALIIGAPVVAWASPPSDFFKGKTIKIITSTGPGGTYDLIARLLARRMPRYIPGRPDMVVENMPGAGNVLATNYMYNIAPKDGTVIATVHDAMPLYQVLNGRGVRFNANRFNWLGSTGPQNEAIIVWHTAGVKTIEQARKKPVILGATGAGSGIAIIPAAMNHVLGTKFKIVLGYKSSEDVNLAMERGEVEARAFSMGGILAKHADWMKKKKIYVIAQAGAERERDMPNAPLLTELAKTAEQRKIMRLISSPSAFGYPFLAPPGVPPNRLAILRKAFKAALADPVFLAEAAKAHIALKPTSGGELAAFARETVGASPAIIAKARAAISVLENKPATTPKSHS